MKIEIKLLSDLCNYSGETYNTTVDNEVVYDDYGLPYIPAKRIKGCIREAALELKELGLIEHYDEIFGDKGNQRSLFSLSNAILSNRDNLIKAIKNFKRKDIVEPLKVLDEFTYTRTQTSVDYDTGVALDNSLRTSRVIKKGLIFKSSLEFNNLEYLDEFKKAVSLVKHMGISRTRGLGLVNLKVIEEDNNTYRHVLFDNLYEHNKISYTIHTKSKLICKSPMGNQAKSEDYIAGSKVLGLIAGCLGNDGYQEIMNKIIVSNAYITSENDRCLPGKSSLQKVKNQKYINETMDVSDMLYFKGSDGKQRSPANVNYISKDNVVKSVDLEITYHHQRPNDKSIGRALENDGTFYQLGSISENQTFKGYMYCDRDIANKVIDSISKLKEVRMGYGRSAEFGQVDFKLDEIEEIKDNNELIHECDLLLVSDAILYNKQGMLVTDIRALEDYLNKYYKVDDIKVSRPFLNYSIIGGFNVTWKKRKQTFNALGKGSVLRITSSNGFNGNYNTSNFIGERISEGYGEFILEKIKDSDVVTLYKNKEDYNKLDCVEDKTIVNKLLVRECKKLIDEKVRKIVNNIDTKDNEFNAALSKIRILYRNVDNYKEIRKQISELESSNKDKCLFLLDKLNEEDKEKDIVSACIEEVRKVDNSFNWNVDNNEKLKFLYYSYISQLKDKVKIDNKETSTNV